MKRTNTDLIVGGTILLALFILIAGTLWLKEVSIIRRMMHYSLLFPNVGSLQVGDPVKVNGVKMGSIADISLHGTDVKVVMRVDRRVMLTDSAMVTVQNIGLMGERNIMIQLSNKGNVYPPDNRRDPHAPYLHGRFDTGIAEAMGMVGTVLGEIRVLVGDVRSIVDNTIGDTSFVVFFKTMVSRLDTITNLAEALIVDNKSRLDRSMQNVQAVTGDMKRLLDDNRENISTLLANGSELSGRAMRIAGEVESLSVSLGNMAGSIERGEGSLGMLIEDDRFYRDLKATVAKLDTLAGDVRDQGLKLRIRFGFRERKQKSD